MMSSNNPSAASTSKFSVSNIADEIVVVVENDENVDIQRIDQSTSPTLSQLELRCKEVLCDQRLVCSELMNASNYDHSGKIKTSKRPIQRLKTELDPADARLVHDMSLQSADQVMEYLRRIKDMACSLGQSQEDQALRAKFLGIFK